MCILPVNKTKEFREREAKNKPVKDYLQLQRDILHCDRVQFSFLFNLLLIIIQVVDFCGDGVHRDSFNGDGFVGMISMGLVSIGMVSMETVAGE